MANVVRGVYEYKTTDYEFGSILYAVMDNSVFSIEHDGTTTTLGTIDSSNGNVFFADNGIEVIIVDGSPRGYLITDGVLTTLGDPDFPGGTSVTFQDGYFIVTRPDTGAIYISGLYDGTSWDPLDFGLAEANPDFALCVISNSRDLWIFGEKVTEIFQNTGNADFPFERIPGAIIELGLQAIGSAIKINGIAYWLSTEERVVRGKGYQYETISTPHIDYQISTYSTTSDAKAFSYQMLGHIFYVLIFPSEDKTWVYDITTGFWHEWQSYVVNDDGRINWGRHRSNCGCKFGNDYVVGDYQNGKVLTLDINTYTDNGNEIQRIRVSPVVNKEMFNVVWHRLQIDFESGVGLATGQGSDPIVNLDWSDDGGHTWSNKHPAKIGKIGNYRQRVVWRRLGKSRNRVLRTTITDPVKVVMLAAYAELEECKS